MAVMAEPVSLRFFLGDHLAKKYLGEEPVALEDWGHGDCEICEAARALADAEESREPLASE